MSNTDVALPTWVQHLEALQKPLRPLTTTGNDWDNPDVALNYLLVFPENSDTDAVRIGVAERRRKKSGEWSKPVARMIGHHDIPLLPDARDRQIIAQLTSHTAAHDPEAREAQYFLTLHAAPLLIESMCETGRCFLHHLHQETPPPEPVPLCFDSGEPWAIALAIQDTPAGFRPRCTLVRGDRHLEASTPEFISPAGLMLLGNTVARLELEGYRWLALTRTHPDFAVPAEGTPALMAALYGPAEPRQLRLPANLQLAACRPTPIPHVRIEMLPPVAGLQEFVATLSFDYAGTLLDAGSSDPSVVEPLNHRVLYRDPTREAEAVGALLRHGARAGSWEQGRAFYVKNSRRNEFMRGLLDSGCVVNLGRRTLRQADKPQLKVTSGIDWFDVTGGLNFEDTEVPLPRLLQALQRGETTLDVGSDAVALIPTEWLSELAALGELGTAHGDALRFNRSQLGVIDALLQTLPEVSVDERYARARTALAGFAGITPIEPPKSFKGTLRSYQREGLGWLLFLRRLELGGCLADDMGLGKTVQVLALLAEHYERRTQATRPSLIVVPRSLVFNWRIECKSFTPHLRLLEYTGSDRKERPERLAQVDLILTTYGTLKRDALMLRNLPFDYVILDEAQAIKNANTDIAKCVRLLTAKHRLALTGTPVENHLGELWSLFEFLNPGMLGASRVAKQLESDSRNPDAATARFLSTALRPFILRRTKAHVAPDLPAKLEETIYCELSKHERSQYQELLMHYRQRLLGAGDPRDLNRSRMQVVEALLRLRQAACHPGLIDHGRMSESSAKLDALFPMLDEVLEEGHKALVFSQFTTFLGLVRERCEVKKLRHAYLDGATRDRQAAVDKFQTDPDYRLFLVSLKAGGVGLNLTAADYVFLLDPWWNPAAEAQAIDRTHRLGQKRQVFAYRLVARDTIEEKVLALQQQKRHLADAVLSGDNGLLKNIGIDELKLLLS